MKSSVRFCVHDSSCAVFPLSLRRRRHVAVVAAPFAIVAAPWKPPEVTLLPILPPLPPPLPTLPVESLPPPLLLRRPPAALLPSPLLSSTRIMLQLLQRCDALGTVSRLSVADAPRPCHRLHCCARVDAGCLRSQACPPLLAAQNKSWRVALCLCSQALRNRGASTCDGRSLSVVREARFRRRARRC